MVIVHFNSIKSGFQSKEDPETFFFGLLCVCAMYEILGQVTEVTVLEPRDAGANV